MEQQRCGFCGSVIEAEQETICFLCDEARHTHCAPVCCEAAIADACDGWLQGFAEQQIERL